MKTWEIYHYTYTNAGYDPWYGKRSNHTTIGYVTDTEDNVKSFVEKLNERNRSYYGKEEPEDEYDDDFDESDYISYVEVKINTFEELEKRYI